MKNKQIRQLRRIALKKSNYSEAVLDYSKRLNSIFSNFCNCNICKNLHLSFKDRKSQKRLLPPHLRMKKIPKMVEILLWA